MKKDVDIFLEHILQSINENNVAIARQRAWTV